ncbi:hypothetical protein DH2020_041634 [Rehmannia glutinosa]|uniref:Protein PHOTOPERIOD-INDEPENDENT EARLY FLOWERING 1 n=1 Tax=Rehmannia glutinosa TaxID=99300 RepID=A0ABR0URN6_REHGL
MYEKRLNGILADEMGLGKTIMTIALLAHLACEKGIWGPHLIVVPTSVMLNWETEFLKWCPAFKILTYFGSAKERRIKRQGWLKPNSFHVCITTYRLVIQDSKVFKRKKWKYLILDEAHLIKNWKSQRWQTLLNFNSKRRILLTGTPLQNDLMELWSLMHFLMPHIFQSHQEFKDWFSNPISGMVEGQEKVNKEVVDRLHNVLRPFILRRLKRDVEKQLPMKLEHVIYCRLSRRQRNLYEDFIASSETQATLASSNFFGMISVIMQLRKVCNHPDLFEGRPIVSSFDMSGMDMQLSSSVCSMLAPEPFSTVDLSGFGFVFTHLDFSMTSWESEETQAIATPSSLIEQRVNLVNLEENWLELKHKKKMHSTNIFEEIQKAILDERLREAKERAAAVAWWNSLRCKKNPCRKFHVCNTPRRAPPPVCWCSKGGSPVFIHQTFKDLWSQVFFPLLTPFRSAIVRRQVYFPDRRLIQFDCGKLQELAVLLRRLKSEGHRALIFTQMTKMLDILEAFINLYGYTYMRLDGSTPPEERQTLMQRFNTNPKIFLFILSTRSGGVGINLVGADTVIFYDSDWNPAMDQQAQDRCHRIGQTREVHIYRLISHRTVAQKDIQTEKPSNNTGDITLSSLDLEAALKNAEDEADYMALKKVEEEEAVDNQEFTEEAVGKLEDDELANEEEMKPDGPAEHSALNAKSDEGNVVSGSHPVEEGALTFHSKEDDVDMLADVKEMAAAAAAAGQAILSFENQLRPIDRYAHIEETEWELEHIEKLKDDMEAEIDDDEEPLVYESMYFLDITLIIFVSYYILDDYVFVPPLYALCNPGWDADFATEVYKQQVEALAQHQLMEDLEREAQEKEALENGNSDSPRNDISVARKTQVEEENQKTKFKSLKKGALVSKSISVKEESSIEQMSIDDDLIYDEITSSDALSPCSTQEKKRKPASDDDEPRSRKKSKKLKASELGHMLLYPKLSGKHQNEFKDLRICDNGVVDLESKHISRSKARGKLSISIMPLKRVFTIKPEKSKKKGSIWSKDILPSPDLWSPTEDAVLCAVVHEYGPNWNLASEILFGMTAGGSYRGRFRHPVHCSERFRELLQRYVFSVSEHTNNEKAGGVGSGKALLRVTEARLRRTSSRHGGGARPANIACLDLVRRNALSLGMPLTTMATGSYRRAFNNSGYRDNIQVLLGITSELPDHEPLLQKHFLAVLSAAWRDLSRSSHRNNVCSSQNGFYPSQNLSGSRINHQNSLGKLPEKLEFTNLHQCGKLVAAALDAGDCSRQTYDTISISNQEEEPLVTKERLDVTLELRGERDEASSLPSVVNLSILGPDPPLSLKMHAGENRHFKSARGLVESQLRTASDDTRCWNPQLQNLGKHKLPISDLGKLSKSKSKKTNKGHTDSQCLTASEIFQHTAVMPTDPTMGFDELSSCFSGAGILESNWLLDVDGEVDCLGTLGFAPFDFGADLTSDLDDLSILPEFTDIGRGFQSMKVSTTQGWGNDLLCCRGIIEQKEWPLLMWMDDVQFELSRWFTIDGDDCCCER